MADYDIDKVRPRPWTHKYYDYWYDANGVCFYDCEHEGGFHEGEEAIYAFHCTNEHESLLADRKQLKKLREKLSKACYELSLDASLSDVLNLIDGKPNRIDEALKELDDEE